MRTLTPRQLAALHKVIDIVVKLQVPKNEVEQIEHNLTLSIAKKAMQQVHIQQVYLTKQGEGS